MGRRGLWRGGSGDRTACPRGRVEPLQAGRGPVPIGARTSTYRRRRRARRWMDAWGERLRERGRGAETAMAQYRGKVGAVYAVITDFSLQLQRSEKPGTELGKPCAGPAPVPVVGARRGAGHTKWRDRPVPVRWRSAPCLPPSQLRWAAAARERPRLRRMPRCLPISTAPSASLRSATRAPGRSGRSDGIHLRSEHSPRERAGPAKESACRHTPYRPALGGRREYGGHTPSWQGRAVRGGSPRGGVSIGLTASRTAPGSGCPLRPRGAGGRVRR